MARLFEGAELGQLGDKSAGDDGADTGHGGEEVLPSRARQARRRTAPSMSPSRLSSSRASAFKSLSMLLRTRSGAPARRWRSEVIMATIWRRRATSSASRRVSASWSGRISGAVASMKCAITAASMASVFARLPSAPAKGADLGRVDDDDGQAGLGEARDHDGLEASGRLKPDRLGSHCAQPLDQRGDAFGVARDIEAVVRATNVHVEAILGNVDTDDGGDGVHCLPSLRKRASLAAQATVRVQWNGERGPMLTHGLGVPEGRRASRSPPPPALYQCRCDESYKGR